MRLEGRCSCCCLSFASRREMRIAADRTRMACRVALRNRREYWSQFPHTRGSRKHPGLRAKGFRSPDLHSRDRKYSASQSDSLAFPGQPETLPPRHPPVEINPPSREFSRWNSPGFRHKPPYRESRPRGSSPFHFSCRLDLEAETSQFPAASDERSVRYTLLRRRSYEVVRA